MRLALPCNGRSTPAREGITRRHRHRFAADEDGCSFLGLAGPYGSVAGRCSPGG
jgi:hypothetical protein